MVRGFAVIGVLAGALLASFLLYFIGWNNYTELSAKIVAVTAVMIAFIALAVWNKGSKVLG